jgi:formylmethanofuran dehydrogenase subunit B
MLCCFCSLLCDREDLHRGCEIRANALTQLIARERTSLPRFSGSQTEIDDLLINIRKKLIASTNILLTGRIFSVETSRTVLALARTLGASLDASELGWAMNNALATAKNGAFTTSLADARATSQTFIVLDDGSLLDRFPRLPHLLCESIQGQTDPRTVLLLGTPTEATKEAWASLFPNTWSVHGSMEQFPTTLNQWTSTRNSPDPEDSTPWLVDLKSSTYTSVVWSPGSLSVSQSDLWIEDLMHWIRMQNEETRCSSLTLSGLEATFQQACTWTTGFPGRIRFRDEVPLFEPTESNYLSWIDRYRHDPRASIVCIDESARTEPFLSKNTTESFAGTIVEIHGNRLEVDQEFLQMRLPTRTAGFDMNATLSRADQVVMAFVASQSSTAEDWPTPSEWLTRLTS